MRERRNVLLRILPTQVPSKKSAEIKVMKKNPSRRYSRREGTKKEVAHRMLLILCCLLVGHIWKINYNRSPFSFSPLDFLTRNYPELPSDKNFWSLRFSIIWHEILFFLFSYLITHSYFGFYTNAVLIFLFSFRTVGQIALHLHRKRAVREIDNSNRVSGYNDLVGIYKPCLTASKIVIFHAVVLNIILCVVYVLYCH